MCGIAGVLTAGRDAPSLDAPVEVMRRAVRHRGPDDEGTWRSRNGHAIFAHTRLAILDLTAAGHQPMSTPDGRYSISFNGEILNFQELRRSLERRGVQFHTRCDTEVILRAYEADGPACIARLRGMFAFALWDDHEHTCLLARDRFGIKPLYYHYAAGRLTFASEVKALVASGLVPHQLDPDGLFGYFLTGTVPEPCTLLRDVKCLEAGSYAIWKNGSLTSRKYWELSFEAAPDDTDPVDRVRTALLDSVEHHFISDAPVGVFLSGGIDSTALVALASKNRQRDLHTFSLAFPGWVDDEGGTASHTAAHFGTRHTEWSIDATTAMELFRGFLSASDQPSIDGLNTFAVSKLAREHGMKVVLSGLGGDELFGGYKTFEQVPRLAALNRRLSYAGPLRTAVGEGLQRIAGDPRVRRVGDALTHPPNLANTYTMFRGIFTRAEAHRLVRCYVDESPRQLCHASDDIDGSDPTPRDAISRLELTRFMRNQPLRDSDTMSMAWGLELRVPFLDGPLVDTLSRIPSNVRLQPGKRFLLQAVPEVPEWVASQPKRGFLFPFERWLGDEWRSTFAAVERDSPVPAETWYRKWCLFMMRRWADRLVAGA
jgi:asparagine synthase (glutamine-hydrolysing)